MGDLGRELESVLTHVEAQWDEERAAAGAREFARRRRRRAATRRIAGAATVLAVLAGGGAALLLRPAPRPPIATTVPDRVLRFADGSTVTPMNEQSVLRSSAPTAAELLRGGAQVLVTRDPARRFRFAAGVVIIESLGARFASEMIDERVRITVVEGEVRVLWAADHRDLAAGESGLFPPEPAKTIEDRPSPPARHAAPHATAPEPTWRNLAEEGDYDKAYVALQRSGAPSVRDQPAELLLAADVARLSHHPAEALAPLNRIVREHASDARAPLAAFTLGRVLLDDLGQPTEAARAFAEAEALAPRGALSEDAVAREVEAWFRAGDAERARARAEDYVRRFPDGRRLRSVRRFGGLD